MSVSSSSVGSRGMASTERNKKGSRPEMTMDNLSDELESLLEGADLRPESWRDGDPTKQAGAILQLLEESRRQTRKLEDELLTQRRKALDERKRQSEITNKFAEENQKLTQSLTESEDDRKRLEEVNRMLELHNRALKDSNKLLSKDKLHLRRENVHLLRSLERLQQQQQASQRRTAERSATKLPPKPIIRDVNAENQALSGINALLRQELSALAKPSNTTNDDDEEDVDCDFQSCIMDETMDEGDRKKTTSKRYENQRKAKKIPTSRAVDARVKVWHEMQRAGWTLYARDPRTPRVFVSPGTDPNVGVTGIDMFSTFEEAVATFRQHSPMGRQVPRGSPNPIDDEYSSSGRRRMGGKAPQVSSSESTEASPVSGRSSAYSG